MKLEELNALTEITDTIRASIRQNNLSTMTLDELLDELVALSAEQDDYSAVLARLQYTIQSVQRWQMLLQETFTQVQALETQRKQRERYSEKWWEKQRTTLERAFQNDRDQAWQQWLRSFSESLCDWELEICLRLINTPFDFPHAAQPTLNILHRGVDALIDKQPSDALDMFTHLTQDTTQPRDEPLRGILTARIGQIYLYDQNQPRTARAQLNLAQALAPADGRPQAAMGDYHRVQGEVDQAERLYQQAIDLAPMQPEGYVGMGLVAEKQGWWDEAEEWYAQAIAKVQSAHSVDVALRKVIGFTKAEGDYPERLYHRFAGMLLEIFGQPTEAARAYYEAGVRYHWRQESLAAIDLLRKANELNPNHPSTYWQLSDALLSMSYRPTPPYVEGPFVRESLEIWEEGAQRGFTPDAGQAWSYVSRALINEQLTRLPDDLDRTLLWWEGIAFFERSLLLSDTNSYAWSYLSRYHHNLEHEACAAQAFEKALENAPDDAAKAVALGEQATLLANIGYLEEAKAAIDAYLALKDDLWIRGTQAFVLAFTGEYAESLKILDKLITEAPENMWYREVRIFCYRRLDRIDDVIADSRWMWNLRDDPNYANQQSAIGWAAFSLFLFGKQDTALVNQAIDIYHRLPKDDSPMILRNLGIFHLAKGQITEGEQHLIEGIRITTSFRELDELRDADLADLLRFSTSWPYHDQIRRSLESLILPAIEVRRTEIGRRKTALEEMRLLRDSAQRADPADGWMLIGAQAGLARLYSDQTRWNEAADIYQKLRAEAHRFPEAVLGLQKIAVVWRDNGDARLQDHHPDEAQRYFAYAIALDAYPDDANEQASLYSYLGLALLELQRDAEARAAFADALDLYKSAAYLIPGEELGTVCSTQLRDVAHYWAVDAAWKAWKHNPKVDADLRLHLSTARQTLRHYLDDRYGLASDSALRTPVVTPIVVEIGHRLIPDDPGPGWVLLKTYLPEMRARIQSEMGMSVPGVRIRSSDALDAQSYVISINDVPVVSGNVYGDKRFTPASPAALDQAGVTLAGPVDGTDPTTGKPGNWVNYEDWDAVTDAGFELWDDALDFIVRHLESVLRQNLADFLGLQKVENLLETWSETEESTTLIATALPDDASRLRFARVLRALVGEQVPITRWQRILETVQQTGLDADDVIPVISAVRRQLKVQLPGNAPDARRVELPAGLEDKVHRQLRHRNGKTFLALLPETTQEVIDTLHKRADANDRDTVLVTRTDELRPYLYRLVSLEFPYIMVLARAEVHAGAPITAEANDNG